MWCDRWRVLMAQQRCVIHTLGRRLQGKKLWKLWRPSLSDLLQRIWFSPPCMSTSAGILQTGVFFSGEGVVFQTVVIKLWMRVTNLSLSDESGLPEASRSLVSASSHRTDGCWKLNHNYGSLSGVITVWWTSHRLLWFSMTWQKCQQRK